MTIKDIILYSILFILFIIVLLVIISKSACNKKSCKNCSTCSFGKCKCKDGYKGNDCEIDNRCEGKECKNSGSCVNGDCSCVNGWEGSDCGTKQLMSFNLSSGYTLKSKLYGDIYEYFDKIYRQLYNTKPTETNPNIAKIANIYFYDIKDKGKVGILKYNTPYNLVTSTTELYYNRDNDCKIIDQKQYRTILSPYGGGTGDCKATCPDTASLRAWGISVPWDYELGRFYISPIIGKNIDKTITSDIKQNIDFVIRVIPDIPLPPINPPIENKYMKNTSTKDYPIVMDKLNTSEIDKYIFTF